MDLLDLKFVVSHGSQLRDGVRIVDAEVTVQPVECPHCEAADPYRHDSREQEFADAPIRGQPIRIRFQRRRYRCRQCRKTFFEPLQGFSVKRNMTRRLVHYIARDSLIRTFSDVARDVAMDVQTVRAVFLDFSRWLQANHPIATPRIMGIDEAKRAKVLCTVLTDLERREYFDMLPSRQAKALNEYLGKLPDKDKVQVVCMDLHQGFVTAIGRHLPKAVRVADRYHVARLAQEAFGKTHLQIRKPLPKGLRLAAFHQRGLLATRERDLSTQQRQKVAQVLAPFPELEAAYRAKEAFLAIYDAPSRQEADQMLSHWLDSLPGHLRSNFAALISAVSNNREIILNYFNHRYTNAYTEAANGISKLLQKTGRGYGYEVMKVKLLYGKLGQVIDLDTFDNQGGVTIGYACAASRTMMRSNQPQPAKRQRRGPRFDRVERLIDQGYYDMGNPAIANEMASLIQEFAATY